MAKKFFTLLIFSIAVAFTGGCSSPIGSLQIDSDSNSDATLDFIRVEPERFVYSDEYDPFIPAEDVHVFGVFGGKEKPIAIEEVEKIIISEYPFSTNEPIVLSELDREFEIQLNSGRKSIVISYKGMETLYRISVGETKTGDDNNSDPGTIIDWEWPDD